MISVNCCNRKSVEQYSREGRAESTSYMTTSERRESESNVRVKKAWRGIAGEEEDEARAQKTAPRDKAQRLFTSKKATRSLSVMPPGAFAGAVIFLVVCPLPLPPDHALETVDGGVSSFLLLAQAAVSPVLMPSLREEKRLPPVLPALGLASALVLPR